VLWIFFGDSLLLLLFEIFWILLSRVGHGLVVFWICEPVLGFLEGFLDGSAFCSILIIELIVSSMFRDVFSLLKQT
jgi:hypothetical protein